MRAVLSNSGLCPGPLVCMDAQGTKTSLAMLGYDAAGCYAQVKWHFMR